MRQVLNFFIVGIVLWLSSLIFPDHIHFDNFGSIVLTTLLVYLVETLVALVIFGLLAMSKNRNIVVWIIVFILFALFSGTATLLISSGIYEGFQISGFWTAFLLSFGCTIFTTNIKRGS